MFRMIIKRVLPKIDKDFFNEQTMGCAYRFQCQPKVTFKMYLLPFRTLASIIQPTQHYGS